MWGLVCIVGSREFQDLSLQGTGGLYLKFILPRDIWCLANF